MTENQFVEEIFVREGIKYGDQTTVPKIDQPTGPGGITLPVMSWYLGHQATIDDLKNLTKETAAPIVKAWVRKISKENNLDAIGFEPLRLQMVDFIYNSPAALAIRWLQRVLRIPRTGKMDSSTIAALDFYDQWLVNQALIAARLQMIDMWTDSDKQAKAWEEGLESRGLTFSLLEVP